MIRRFSLQNEYGQRWDLNDLATGFFYEPQGLGFSMDHSYNRAGVKWIRNYLRDAQSTISGTIVFGTEKPYVAFSKFSAFVNTAASLQLIYETDAGEYLKDVDLVKLDKGEMNHERHTLDVPAEFICTSLFYHTEEDRYVVQSVEGETRYDFRYPARFNDYDSRTLHLVNDGHVPAGFYCEIYGYAENPTITVYVNQHRVGRVKFPTVLEEGDVQLFSTVDGNMFCTTRRAEAGKGYIDVRNLDITNNNFFKLPVGSFDFVFSSDTPSTNRTVLVVYKYYRVV